MATRVTICIVLPEPVGCSTSTSPAARQTSVTNSLDRGAASWCSFPRQSLPPEVAATSLSCTTGVRNATGCRAYGVVPLVLPPSKASSLEYYFDSVRLSPSIRERLLCSFQPVHFPSSPRCVGFFGRCYLNPGIPMDARLMLSLLLFCSLACNLWPCFTICSTKQCFSRHGLWPTGVSAADPPYLRTTAHA